MQHILVTGGAGRLGRLVVKHLSAAGYPVRGMSRRASPGEDWPGAEWKQADLKTGVGLAEVVQGMDVVVHLAAKGSRSVEAACRHHLARTSFSSAQGMGICRRLLCLRGCGCIGRGTWPR
jgi:nucleoside-diphosphate-sugar epimerase